MDEIKYIKYPRTFHCPWSGYIGDDDKISSDLSVFDDKIVITEKMDGENTTMYNDRLYARSIDGNSHWTQSYVRQLHSTISHEIPYGWRICGENVYAKHSIEYNNLDSYFYVFSIWNENNECLSWDDTVFWCELLELPHVPVLFNGKWDKPPHKIHEYIWDKKVDESSHEGYVIRSAESFIFSDFRKKVLKYVRPNHVTTTSHWKYGKIEINKLNEK